MAPGIAAHQHLGTGVTVGCHAVAFLPMGLKRLAQQSVLGPDGILAHGRSDVVEHLVLVVVVNQAVVEREDFHLLGKLRHKHHLGGLERHLHGSRGGFHKHKFSGGQIERHVIGTGRGRHRAGAALHQCARGIVAREVALGTPHTAHAQALIDAPVTESVVTGRECDLALKLVASGQAELA